MLEIFKKNLATFVQGALFGLGFCLAAWVLYFAFQAKAQETPSYLSDKISTSSAKTKVNHFTFSGVEEIKKSGRPYFIGKVKNDSSSTARGVSIEVNLFNKDKFVDQYSSYVTGDLEPNEERYFKVSCGCKDEPPADHDSYKIGVVGGY